MQLILEARFQREDQEMLMGTLNFALSQQKWESLSAYSRRVCLETQRKLREYVDDWLDSGVRADGTEAPGERNYDRARKVQDCVAFYSYFCSTWITLPPGEQYPEVRMGMPGLKCGRVRSQLLAEYEATEMIVMLLLSGLRRRIAKCRYEKCGRYFLLNEKPRKETYAHGLFCSGLHNRRASATKLVKERRDMFNPTVIAWAGDVLSQQKSKMGEDAAFKRKLLRELNTRIRKDPDLHSGRRRNRLGTYIEVNWLTKHWEEIQAKAEEIRNATR